MNAETAAKELLKAEDLIDNIQRSGIKREHPKAWGVLEEIRALLNIAYIKFNEGDDCQ